MEHYFQDFQNLYDTYMEKSLPNRNYDLATYWTVVSKFDNSPFSSLVSQSKTLNDNTLSAYSIGNGTVKVLAWSQMHGNEPTSTLALLDVMNFMTAEFPLAQYIREKITFITIPLLNPDGFQINNRRNTMGIDINRDASDLVSPEAKFLMINYLRNRPNFALNLHDQELYYTTKPYLKQTLIALLSPECNYEKTLSGARTKAMQVIGVIVQNLLGVASGRIAKYQDSYTPTAFGDTFTRSGTSTILIEAGSVADDPERLTARKMMFLSILTALHSIASESYRKMELAIYENLPLNIKDNAFDLKLRNIQVDANGWKYRIDIGIRRTKKSGNPEDFTDTETEYCIANIGNLSANGAIKDYDMTGNSLASDYNILRIGNKADFDIRTADNKILNVKTLLQK